eukprot:gene4764-9480_t
MATIQHVEKLIAIKRAIAHWNGLESEVARERIDRVVGRTEKVLRQREFLREERRRLRLATEYIESRKKSLDVMRRYDWLSPYATAIVNKRHLKFNIGGFIFEISEDVLRRDPTSLLCELCGVNPPVMPDCHGVFYFDRNWWLFRHILCFMRDGILSEDRTLLAQLYKEGGFWKLTQLRMAIEEEKLHLRDPPGSTIRDKEWWRRLPSYFQSIGKPPNPEPPKPSDWWMDGTYKGKVYLEKVSDKDIIPTYPPAIWGLPLPQEPITTSTNYTLDNLKGTMRIHKDVDVYKEIDVDVLPATATTWSIPRHHQSFRSDPTPPRFYSLPYDPTQVSHPYARPLTSSTWTLPTRSFPEVVKPPSLFFP